MATLKAVVRTERADGFYPVYIRVTHKRNTSFIKTDKMVSKKQLLGMRIKEFREKRKFTQDKLAEIVGIDPKHLSRIENGRNYPSFEPLEKILDSLEISYEDIFKYSHFLDKKFLIENIEKKLPTLDNEKLKFIYKMINEL